MAPNKMTLKYFYYTDKIQTNTFLQALSPFIWAGKSRNAQGGGVLIAMDSGLGRGSTFCNSDKHLAFQFAPFVTQVLSHFYGRTPMIRVLERFRVKDKKQWKSNAHIDIQSQSLIPRGFVATLLYSKLTSNPRFKRRFEIQIYKDLFPQDKGLEVPMGPWKRRAFNWEDLETISKDILKLMDSYTAFADPEPECGPRSASSSARGVKRRKSNPEDRNKWVVQEGSALVQATKQLSALLLRF